jgi:starvation-inducible DNA-binding protein
MTTQTATSTPALTEPPALGEAHVAFLSEHVLGHHERREIGLRLQDELIDLVDLTLIGKQLHWNVVGPHFRTLHLYLDELVDEWRLLADAVAERATALGFFPDGQCGTIAQRTEFKPLPEGALSDRHVLYLLQQRMKAAVERGRDRMDELGEIDSASEDVMIEVIRKLEEQLWMVRAQFETG